MCLHPWNTCMKGSRLSVVLTEVSQIYFTGISKISVHFKLLFKNKRLLKITVVRKRRSKKSCHFRSENAVYHSLTHIKLKVNKIKPHHFLHYKHGKGVD